MKNIKHSQIFYIIVMVFLLNSIAYAESGVSLEHFGFIESIQDDPQGNSDLKYLKVSGKKYAFNWGAVQVLYKGIYVDVSALENGMKVKFFTGPDSNHISKVVILSERDMLLNQ